MTPFVSVIMPIRNEADFIARSLGAVLAQDYPHEKLEVLVADGMSDDDTRRIVHELAAATDIAVILVINPGRIVPTGFNTALKQAQGEIIVRVDGHTIIARDYVAQCVAVLARSGADNVGGRMNAVGDGAFGQAVALATSSAFGVGGARFHYATEEEYVDTVYMGAWRRDVFERIGMFDEAFVRNQDDEFNYRLRAQGGRILLSPAIQSTYFNRSTFRGLARQYDLYGLYKVRVMQKHPGQMRPRQFAPAVLVSALGIGAVLSVFSRLARWLWLALIVVYTLANLAASVLTARKARWTHLHLLPVVFATLHFSYGIGFLRGLVKFRNHWSKP
jgi:glycosyltransferase involved in cell wall biosynthesis